MGLKVLTSLKVLTPINSKAMANSKATALPNPTLLLPWLLPLVLMGLRLLPVTAGMLLSLFRSASSSLLVSSLLTSSTGELMRVRSSTAASTSTTPSATAAAATATILKVPVSKLVLANPTAGTTPSTSRPMVTVSARDLVRPRSLASAAAVAACCRFHAAFPWNKADSTTLHAAPDAAGSHLLLQFAVFTIVCDKLV